MCHYYCSQFQVSGKNLEQQVEPCTEWCCCAYPSFSWKPIGYRSARILPAYPPWASTFPFLSALQVLHLLPHPTALSWHSPKPPMLCSASSSPLKSPQSSSPWVSLESPLWMPVTTWTQGWHALWSKFLVLRVAVLMAVIDKLAGLGDYVTSDNQCPHFGYIISGFHWVVFLSLLSVSDLMPGLGHHHNFWL